MHVAAYFLGRAGEQAARVLLVPQDLLILGPAGLLFQPVDHARVAAASTLALAFGQEVAKLVADHREQPATEGAALGVIFESANGTANSL